MSEYDKKPYWCPKCERFVMDMEVSYGYHKSCREDVMEVEREIGVYLRLDSPEAQLIRSKFAMGILAQDVVNRLNDNHPGVFPYTLSCGYGISFAEAMIQAMDLHDVPCPCGLPWHKLMEIEHPLQEGWKVD